MKQSKFSPSEHYRRSIRLKGYNYSSEGTYYVTIVTQGRECLFGEIIDGEMYISEYGEIVQQWWNEIPVHFSNVELGAFVIMPNHVHGIIFITTKRRGEVISPRSNSNQDNQEFIIDEEISHVRDESMKQGGGTPPLHRRTLGQIVAYFKYQSTKEMNMVEETNTITKFWQRNYHDRVIRNEKELKQKTDYILDNPSRWDEDAENPRKR